MSMQIANNEQAQTAMTYVNSHQTSAEKLFERLSTGLKIISAADNSSAWAMGERMRELIRSFSQDHQNVQNDSALARTAERGINQIIQNLRTLKELSIDSANDSNSDWDRKIIQKEVDQRLEIIDDIAHSTEYNGKILLNGTYRTYVNSFENDKVEDILASIEAAYNSSEDGRQTNGGSKEWRFNVNKSFGGDGEGWSWSAAWYDGAAVESKQTNQFAVSLDFSGITAATDYPRTLDKQGFSILCGGCQQFINIVFDASKSAAESAYGKPPGAQSNSQAREFVIGVKNVQSAEDLAEAIFKGVYANKSKIRTSPSYDESTEDNVLLDYSHELRLARDPEDHSKFLLLKNGSGPSMQFLDHAVRKPVKGNPIWIQHGTLAGQRFNIYINSMTKKDLGLDNLSVRTREDATSSIGIIDDAIEYALNEATNLGAYLQRLEVTSLNVTTQNENAQASESIVRDADMAKEMVSYTRYNLLLQSSQAMLAQANQNSEEVIGYM